MQTPSIRVVVAALGLFAAGLGGSAERAAAATTPDTVRASVSTGGAEADATSGSLTMSRSGRYVVFVSDASFGSQAPGLFVRDRDTDGDGVFDEPGAVRTTRIDWGSHPSISSDGRFISYSQRWDVGEDANQVHVFVHDRDSDGNGVFDEPGATRTVELASIWCYCIQESHTRVSGDGRFVAYEDNPSGNAIQVLVHRMGHRGAVIVSRSGSGAVGNASSYVSGISAGGRYVSFVSNASNLVAGDTNHVADVFVRDRDADHDGIFDEPGAVTTRRISLSSRGAQSSRPSRGGAISADGRFVTFVSAGAVFAAPRDTNGVLDVFVRDRDSDADGVFDEPGAMRTRRISLSTLGGQADGPSHGGAISADGRFVAFVSAAANLVTSDTNRVVDVFVRDRDSDVDGVFDEPGAVRTRRASLGPDGLQADRSSPDSAYVGFSWISDPIDWPAQPAVAGGYVAFTSSATNLVAGDGNGHQDVFVRGPYS